MRTELWVFVAVALVGCGMPEGGSTAGLAAGDGDLQEPVDGDEPDDDEPPGDDCEILVEFECECVVIDSCKDLSNVVIEYEDGTRERFEGLTGTHDRFCGDGRPVGRAWVKSGANHSGEGPGYGERFDAPDGYCEPREGDDPPPPPPQDPGDLI